MPSLLLETKFFVPSRRRGVVTRARLRERLDRSTEVKVTLMAAPAGFGKTTLLADWLAARSPESASVAWLSLDQGDDDPASFWTYLIAALQIVLPDVGADALVLLRSPQPPSIEAVLTTLLNELNALGNDVVLVLDDYDLLEAPDIHTGMAYPLNHLPPRMHRVIASRADPPLPLPRLRARGELVEVRAADLRFTAEEAAAYLNDVMGLHLGATDVAALEDRTEGWIAALQLAALSIQGRDDVASFIAGFAGDDRYIVDYLVQEVLQRQSEAVRSFLLHTSILERLSAQLCDAVTGHHSGKTMPETLERGNLFLIPLDDRRRWYRYHHLFTEVLRTHLLDEQPDLVPALHRRASAWYAGEGEPADAIRHALAAADFPQATDLVEHAAATMLRNRQEGTLLGWLKALPDELLRDRPVLSDIYAGALLSNGRFNGVEARLRDAERWLDFPTDLGRSSAMIVVDEDGYRRLPGTVAVHRAAYALAQGDMAHTVQHARRALDLLAADDHMHVGLSQLDLERDDLEAARQHVLRNQEVGARNGLPQNPYRSRVAMARIREAEGDLDGALELRNEAERPYTSDFGPNVRPIAAMKVRVFIRQGRLGEALAWARSQDVSAEDELSYVREFEHITLARLRLARASAPEALALLDRLLLAAEEGGRIGSVIEIVVLQALAQHQHGRTPVALASLERALTLAEPEGYVRIFVDEGPRMAELLHAAVKRGIAVGYVRALLPRLGAAEHRAPCEQPFIKVEPLSERELDVPWLLASDLNGPDIARELTVSLSTMRTHTRSIFSKLGVSSRRAAARRAEEIRLL